ncbi:MAG: hypothetical protein ACREVW_04270 [Burkholderiales bacterium]
MRRHEIEDEIVRDLHGDPSFLCPAWSQYTLDKSVLELQEAVALLVGINPAHRCARLGWARAQGHRATSEQAIAIQKLIENFDFVSASIGDKEGLLRIAVGHHDPARIKVRLIDFVVWTHAQRDGWDWPKGSPWQRVIAAGNENRLIPLTADDNAQATPAPSAEQEPQGMAVEAAVLSDVVVPTKAGPLPEDRGLPTKAIAHAFDGVNEWPAERWIRNLSSSKWLHPARIALGGAGVASSAWNPLMLAQLMHGRAKGDREKEKVMRALNSRFTRETALRPWRDGFSEYFETYCNA